MVGHRLAKMLSVGCILLFLGSCLLPPLVQSAPLLKTNSSDYNRAINLQSLIRVSWDANATAKPIIPRGELRVVLLNVTFCACGGYFAALLARLFVGRQVTATLQIVDKPSWCTASISSSTFAFYITSHLGDIQTRTTTLSISLSDQAPAFALGEITLKARVKPVHGYFGLINIMRGTTDKFTLTFVPAYKPLLKLDLPQGNTIETPPLVTVELPIIITNLGNGRTVVFINQSENANDWDIQVPAQVILDVGEQTTIMVQITAPANFSGDYYFQLGFTPAYYDDCSLVGNCIYEGFLAYYHST